MKKICSMAVATVLVSGSAFAGSGMHNNMNRNMNNNMNNTATITTVVEPVTDTIVSVSQVPNMRDNQNVVMTGYIIENLGDKMYVFQDSTGSIVVEIDPVLVEQIMISPNTKMKLKGQIEKGNAGEMDIIEVDYITAM